MQKVKSHDYTAVTKKNGAKAATYKRPTKRKDNTHGHNSANRAALCTYGGATNKRVNLLNRRSSAHSGAVVSMDLGAIKDQEPNKQAARVQDGSRRLCRSGRRAASMAQAPIWAGISAREVIACIVLLAFVVSYIWALGACYQVGYQIGAGL